MFFRFESLPNCRVILDVWVEKFDSSGAVIYPRAEQRPVLAPWVGPEAEQTSVVMRPR